MIDEAAIQAEITRVSAPFAREQAKLFDVPTGRPVHVPDVHQEMLADIARRRDVAINAALDTFERQATALESETSRALARYSDDPLLTLNQADLTRAAALHPFLVADVAKLDLPGITTLLEAAQARGDRGEGAALVRVVAARLDVVRASERGVMLNELRAATTALEALRTTLLPATTMQRRMDLEAQLAQAKQNQTLIRNLRPGRELELRQRFKIA